MRRCLRGDSEAYAVTLNVRLAAHEPRRAIRVSALHGANFLAALTCAGTDHAHVTRRAAASAVAALVARLAGARQLTHRAELLKAATGAVRVTHIRITSVARLAPHPRIERIALPIRRRGLSIGTPGILVGLAARAAPRAARHSAARAAGWRAAAATDGRRRTAHAGASARRSLVARHVLDRAAAGNERRQGAEQ